ncbi:MAG: hypothetical protein L6Q94_08565 [Calditrichia bacterium]|nr:hypothetical protein [Calditrichia bacterium]
MKISSNCAGQAIVDIPRSGELVRLNPLSFEELNDLLHLPNKLSSFFNFGRIEK